MFNDNLASPTTTPNMEIELNLAKTAHVQMVPENNARVALVTRYREKSKMAVAGFVKSLGQVSHSFRLISRIYLSNPMIQGKLLR